MAFYTLPRRGDFPCPHTPSHAHRPTFHSLPHAHTRNRADSLAPHSVRPIRARLRGRCAPGPSTTDSPPSTCDHAIRLGRGASEMKTRTRREERRGECGLLADFGFFGKDGFCETENRGNSNHYRVPSKFQERRWQA